MVAISRSWPPAARFRSAWLRRRRAFPVIRWWGNATWALNFGIVTQQGGDINLYADGNISVNQSRVFTLEGGDMTVVSQNGNIDAGKGAKTVLSIQPPNISYDLYGDATITPYGPASGSGLAGAAGIADVPPGNADLIAFFGDVDAGDAGIRVSGNINIAAVKVFECQQYLGGRKIERHPDRDCPQHRCADQRFQCERGGHGRCDGRGAEAQ